MITSGQLENLNSSNNIWSANCYYLRYFKPDNSLYHINSTNYHYLTINIFLLCNNYINEISYNALIR